MPRCSTPEPMRLRHNKNLAGTEIKKVADPVRTVLFFESDAGLNANGGPELFASPLRHHGAMCVGFADGHVELVTESRLSELRWEP